MELPTDDACHHCEDTLHDGSRQHDTLLSKRDLDAHCLSMAELIMRSVGPCVSTAHCIVTA